MTERKLKYRAGIFLICAHLGVLTFAIGLFLAKGFNIDEFTTIMAVVTPVFAGYTTSIIAFIVKDAKVLDDGSSPVSSPFVALTFGLPILMVSVIALSIGLKAFNQVFSNFEDFKRFLLLIETLFASYVGMFVYSLFDRKPAEGVVDVPRTPARQPPR